jgi:CubicO group peptidase (beta-lactamase class C family)
MTRKKIIKRLSLFITLAVLAYIILFCWNAFPAIAAYSAKNACSCTFIQNRTKESIEQEELGKFPLSIGNIEINPADSSVTGSVFGFAKRKAIYRSGFGCTVVNDVPETALRAQRFPGINVAVNDTASFLTATAHTDTAFSFDPVKLDSAVSFLFQPFKDENIYTRAVLVVYHDKIVAEKYAAGYDMNSTFLGWSMAKSITSALMGILVKEGKLNVMQPAPLKEWQDPKDKRHAITIENLLQQTSGLDFTEVYNKPSNATNMLANEDDMGGYTASRPLKHPPGTKFYYSSGNSNILSLIIRNTVGDKDYYEFPYKNLFHKIGMYHTLLEPDASGTFVGSSYVYASARDYARFGLLYLHDGVWNNERILPEGWVQKTVTAPAANELKNYGYQFWLNGLDENDPAKKEFPEAPADLFYADGYGGQRIYIIPSKNLVAARLGLYKFDEHEFLKRLMEAFR